MRLSVGYRGLHTAFRLVILLFEVLICMTLDQGGQAQAVVSVSPGNPAIHLNQVGFLPDAKKVAIIPAEAVRSSSRAFQVLNAAGQTVFKGELKGPIDDRSISGDQVYVADFTPIAVPGKYQLNVLGLGRSHVVTVGAVYNQVFYLVARQYYLQRCGEAIHDAETGINHQACHLSDAKLRHTDAVNAANMPIPSTGGWHDAGDYGKYTTTTTITAAQLLLLYELFPARFPDGQLNIPESGNGVSDLLDEVRGALGWLLTMQRADGAVYHKLSGTTFPGFVLPEADRQQRYIYPITTQDTAKFAAVMAQAARIWRQVDPKFSAQVLAAARKAWQFLAGHGYIDEAQPGDDIGSGGYADTNDKDDRFWAAAELAITTGEKAFETEVINRFTNYADVSWVDASAIGLFNYARLGSNAGLRQLAIDRIVSAADTILYLVQSSPYGVPMQRHDFYWASNKTALAKGMTLIMAHILRPDEQKRAAALDQLDYVLGRNPMDKSYVTGLGANPAQNPHHRLMAATGRTVPGLLVGGPNNTANLVPQNQGPKSYADVQGSYASNEPAIDYNAPLVVLAGYFMQ